jgi:lycopene beta-cyclase
MTTLAKRLPQVNFSKADQPVYVLIGLWVLSMISLPIMRWVYGDQAIVWGVNLSVILQVSAIWSILGGAWGWRRTILTTIVVVILAWTVEAVGTATGFPFSAYHYTPLLQPQLANVPVILPLAWMMMLPASWAVAQLINSTRSKLTFVVISALAMTAWDLFLDPQMVAWDLWTWAEPEGYFGIPWVNYAGWIFASSLITFAARPVDLPKIPLLIIYTITWILETIGLIVFWGLPGPGLVGFVGMGIFVWLAWAKVLEKRS